MSSANINDLQEKSLNVDDDLQKLLRFHQESFIENNQNTINMMSAFNQNFLKQTLANFNNVAPQLPVNLTTGIQMPASPCTTTATAPSVENTPTKRKRQRRNPVWPYFDVVDGTARCKQCLYSTKSVFSTNLKVHLRSHHRPDYEKVIMAEDALNLNALLLSGNTSKLFNVDANRKRMPPMTSSILMTINKLANQQQNGEENPLNAVLRQTLANNGLQQHFQSIQGQFQAAQAALQKQQQEQQQKQLLQQQQAQQAAQQAAQQQPQFALNAANLAALNQLAARNQIQPTPPPVAQDHIINTLNFPAHIKQEILNAPHGTDANGVPQPKRRRLRRHPVWVYFKDLEDRMVGCTNCEFRTGSAFSTNLKMHLKAHHKEDYEKVLQLEEEMRVEEGCFGPNKFKTDLIDYIRGGGNVSTPSAPSSAGATYASSNPKASPLVQQIINQSIARSQSPTISSNGEIKIKKEVDDEMFSGLSSTDKLAALVGIAGQREEVKNEDVMANFEELRQRLLGNSSLNGLLGQQSNQTIAVDLNGSIIASETKSPCSSNEDDRKQERDKALARLWADNETLLTNSHFLDFVHCLAPEYEIPDAEILASTLTEPIQD
ncbi:hypothetical protein L3Y34_001901 [Caenorhabditis briggsae]|nr:hypothetical protein L3Y34_001901 [Caenorhabditis briggsae]